MDSAFKKVGLYDFVGVLLSGMIVVMTGEYLGISTFLIEVPAHGSFDIITLFLESYFLGLLLREFSYALEIKFFKFQRKAMSSYLKQENYVVKNNLELNDFIKMANRILEKSPNNTDFDTIEHNFVFQYCKTYLETRGKDEKDETNLSLFVRACLVSCQKQTDKGKKNHL